MSPAKLFTLGVYGTTEESFFGALADHGITHFVDTRRRRGLRGSQYAYANSARLQAALADRGIVYLHRLDLAPSEALRASSRAAGTATRTQTQLDPDYAEQYTQETLAELDTAAFLAAFPNAARVVLFCVERLPAACHRSLLANHLGLPWEDITP